MKKNTAGLSFPRWLMLLILGTLLGAGWLYAEGNIVIWNRLGNDVSIVSVDGHEYVVVHAGGGIGMTHKCNCSNASHSRICSDEE